jgi:hypothetical protein
MRKQLLGTLATVALSAALGMTPPAAAASTPVHLRVTAFTGAATLTEDVDGGSDTPIFFTEQLKWSLPAPVDRRVVVGGHAKVPVRIHVKASARGVYAVIGENAAPSVPYDCTAQATSVQNARLTVSKAPSGVLHLALALIAPGGLRPGGAECTDEEQAYTFFFPAGTRWMAGQLTQRAVIGPAGAPAGEPVSHIHPRVVHEVRDSPTSADYVERVQFTDLLGFRRLP